MPSDSADRGAVERTLAEEFADLTWAEIEADGVITLDEIEAGLEAKGYPRDSHDHLYE